MKENIGNRFSKPLRRTIIAIVATGAAAAPAAYAKPANNLILVPPTDLPELAQQMRIPAMADSRSGHDGQPRSEAT